MLNFYGKSEDDVTADVAETDRQYMEDMARLDEQDILWSGELPKET